MNSCINSPYTWCRQTDTIQITPKSDTLTETLGASEVNKREEFSERKKIKEIGKNTRNVAADD